MIPSTSKDFLVKDLISGREYELCVLAVYDDGIMTLTATRVVGCLQFTTEQEYSHCQSMHTQFLGGTMIIIIGGIIVASVLVFIIILMIRYKVYNNREPTKAGVSNVCSQTNGGQAGQVTRSTSKGTEIQDEQVQASSGNVSGGVGGCVSGSTVRDTNTVALVVECEKVTQISEMTAEDIIVPAQRRKSRTSAELIRHTSLSSKEVRGTSEGSGGKFY
ncbi:UNVERIFIED_CONTAM: hypothetical protein FKN15_000636 [Acipenser sinensis]